MTKLTDEIRLKVFHVEYIFMYSGLQDNCKNAIVWLSISRLSLIPPAGFFETFFTVLLSLAAIFHGTDICTRV